MTLLFFVLFSSGVTAGGGLTLEKLGVSPLSPDKAAELEDAQEDAKAQFYLWAAEQGDAAAQVYLGSMYYEGEGVKQDYAEAVKWFRKAAEQGHAEAQYNLAVRYAKGEGVQQDDAEALKWCSKAAEQGCAEAQYNLGFIYYNGQGVQQDYAEASKWFRKAAEQGHASAQFNLAVRYAKGEGVQQNYTEAVKWYRKAAEHGYADAQFNLAVMYASGQGMLQSGAAATDWYYKAGLSYLKEGKKDDALRCVERIKNLKTVLNLTVPNAFLADKLLAIIYEGGAANASPALGGKSKAKQDTVSFGTGWPVLGGFVVTNYHVVKGHEEFLLLCKDGQKILAAIAAYDTANDLVLLKATEPCKLPPALPLATRPARVHQFADRRGERSAHLSDQCSCASRQQRRAAAEYERRSGRNRRGQAERGRGVQMDGRFTAECELCHQDTLPFRIAFLHTGCCKYPGTTFWQNRPADIGIQNRTVSNDRYCGIVRLAERIVRG
jgi:hypothetical protein